jgi:hypothetical protein
MSSIAKSNEGNGRPIYGDHFGSLLAGCLLPSFDVPSQVAIGLPGDWYSDPLIVTRHGLKPQLIQYNEKVDFVNYGNIFHQFAKTLGQQSPNSPIFTSTRFGEKGVHHAQLNGKTRNIESVTGERYTDTGTVDSLFGFDFRLIRAGGTHRIYGETLGPVSFLADGSDGYPYVLFDGNYAAEPIWSHDQIDGFTAHANNGGFDYQITCGGAYGTWYYTLSYDNVRIIYDNNTFLAEYNITQFASQEISRTIDGPYALNDAVLKASGKIRMVPKTFVPTTTPYGVVYGGTWTFSTEVTDSYRLGGGAPWSWTHADFTDVVESRAVVQRSPSKAIVLNGPRPEVATQFHEWYWDPTPFYLHRGSKISGFLQAVINDLPNLRPAARISFADAMSKYDTIIQSNHLETLSEIGEIFVLLPSLADIVTIKKKLQAFDIIGTIDAIIDFITGTYLLYKFGTQPTIDGAVEALAKSQSVLERLKRPEFEGGVTYGQFKYDFPEGTYGFKTVSLEVRSKIVLGPTASSLAATLAATGAMGVQPTTSNFWGVVPFSFAVNWPTGLGTQFESIDAFIKAYVYDVKYCVHSYKVIAEVDESKLTAHDLVSVEPVTLSCYIREVSVFPPPPRSSNHKFELPPYDPDSGIVGSLVYQLLR